MIEGIIIPTYMVRLWDPQLIDDEAGKAMDCTKLEGGVP